MLTIITIYNGEKLPESTSHCDFIVFTFLNLKVPFVFIFLFNEVIQNLFILIFALIYILAHKLCMLTAIFLFS